MHKSHLITMMDDYDTATTKTVDRFHIIWIISFPSLSLHMCVHQHITENKTHQKTKQFSTWHLFISSWPLCRHSSSKWCGVKTLERTRILGQIPTSLSRLQTVWSEILHRPGICVTVIVAVVVWFHRWHSQMDVLILSSGGYSVMTWPCCCTVLLKQRGSVWRRQNTLPQLFELSLHVISQWHYCVELASILALLHYL